MSWLYSQALVEEYLEASYLVGEQSAPLSGSHTQQAYCAPDKMTVFSRLSRFGMTYKPLMADRGQDLLTLYLEDFHARTLAPQEKAQELTVNGPECGEKWHASFVKYDHDSSLWRTHQCSLVGDLDEFLETWPQWGLMRDGECWEQLTLEQTIRGTESGLSLLPTPTATQRPCEGTVRIMRKHWESGDFTLEEASAVAGRDVRKHQGKVQSWPTPTANMYKGSSAAVIRKNGQDRSWQSLHYAVEQVTDIGGRLNPTWVEWLMGWPLGWTDLKPLGMDKSLYARQPHGEYSQKDN